MISFLHSMRSLAATIGALLREAHGKEFGIGFPFLLPGFVNFVRFVVKIFYFRLASSVAAVISPFVCFVSFVVKMPCPKSLL